MAKKSIKKYRDTLYRGDSGIGISVPDPDASRSLVRHIMYLEGHGRATPYLSTTEAEETAEHFASSKGRVYTTRYSEWANLEVKHRSKKELLILLRGAGKGDAKWNNAYDVMMAHKYVEEWQEHLADFRDQSGEAVDDIRKILLQMFTK